MRVTPFGISKCPAITETNKPIDAPATKRHGWVRLPGDVPDS